MGLLAPNLINSVDLVSTLPLMLSREQAVKFNEPWGRHRIYVPSDFGGRLTVGFGTALVDPGAQLRLLDEDNNALGDIGTPPAPPLDLQGKPVSIDFAPGERGTGWHYVLVLAPSGSYSLWATFHERGVAREKDGSPLIPWNFWFFPFSHKDPEKTAFASKKLRPLQKYERAFGRRGAVAWEKENHDDPFEIAEPWEGHCDAAADASVIFETPPEDGVTFNGVHFLCEELKLLAAEVAGNTVDARLAWSPFEDDPVLESTRPIDAQAAFGRDPDLLADLLAQLRTTVKRNQQVAVMDLRDSTASDPTEKWNHAVFAYHLDLFQRDAADLSFVDGRLTLFANVDEFATGLSSGLPASPLAGDVQITPNAETRVILFSMRFTPDGLMAPTADENRWRSCRAGNTETFAPRYVAPIVRVDPTLPEAMNPHVRLLDVTKLLALRGKFR